MNEVSLVDISSLRITRNYCCSVLVFLLTLTLILVPALARTGILGFQFFFRIVQFSRCKFRCSLARFLLRSNSFIISHLLLFVKYFFLFFFKKFFLDVIHFSLCRLTSLRNFRSLPFDSFIIIPHLLRFVNSFWCRRMSKIKDSFCTLLPLYYKDLTTAIIVEIKTTARGIAILISRCSTQRSPASTFCFPSDISKTFLVHSANP